MFVVFPVEVIGFSNLFFDFSLDFEDVFLSESLSGWFILLFEYSNIILPLKSTYFKQELKMQPLSCMQIDTYFTLFPFPLLYFDRYLR